MSFSFRQKPLPAKKFERDVLWNLLSFAVLALSGVVANIIIGRGYGAETLGIFNQIFACYIFLSQWAAYGLHLSVLRYTSEFAHNREAVGAIAASALLGCSLTAALVTAVSLLSTPFIGWIFDSTMVEVGWLWVVPGLWFFTINKVLLNILNGLRLMSAFAFWQAARGILLVLILFGLLVFNADSTVVPGALFFSEITLFGGLAAFTRIKIPLHWRNLSHWLKQHLNFGSKSFLSGALLELNSRIDIIVLGIFASDKTVGIYSIAALIVEGLSQVAVVVRNNLNPLITKLYTQQQLEKLRSLIQRTVKLSFITYVMLSLLAALVYPLFVYWLLGGGVYWESLPWFYLLLTGLLLNSGFQTLSMLLLQTGFPEKQTFLTIIVTTANFALNMVLAPILAATGTALATSLSFVVQTIALHRLAKANTGIDIFYFRNFKQQQA